MLTAFNPALYPTPTMLAKKAKSRACKHPQMPPTLAGGIATMMHDTHFWPVKELAVIGQAQGQVKVLEVHKVTLIKAGNLAQWF